MSDIIIKTTELTKQYMKNTVVKSREAYTVDRSSTASPPRAAMMTTMSAIPHSDAQVTP